MTEEPQDLMTYKEEIYGPFHFKDKEGKDGIRVSNRSGKYMVVKSISVRKMPGANNRIMVKVLIPDPEKIEVKENI